MIIVLLLSEHIYHPFKPLYQYAYSSHCYQLHISFGTDKKNSSNNYELLEVEIISLFLITLVFDLAEILSGEIRC